MIGTAFGLISGVDTHEGGAVGVHRQMAVKLMAHQREVKEIQKSARNTTGFFSLAATDRQIRVVRMAATQIGQLSSNTPATINGRLATTTVVHHKTRALRP